MTDEDTVRKFAARIGVGQVNGPYLYRRHGNVKPVWRWSASSYEAFQHTVCLLWNEMGPRRKAKIKELLADYHNYVGQPLGPKPKQERNDRIRQLFADGMGQNAIAQRFQITQQRVSKIVQGSMKLRPW